MNRLARVAFPVLAVASGAMAMGCERREPSDPHEFIAAETARVAREPVVVVTDVPDEQRQPPAGPLRQTVSLGFIGDGPLSDVHSSGYDGGRYASPPAPSYGYGYGGGYGGGHRVYGGPVVDHGFVGGGAHGGRFVSRSSGGPSGGGVSRGGRSGGSGGHGGHGGR